ncbi:MAG: Gfo/Idh/MocA family oxidoreductase [Anaerolineales bacterium]|nr:Gfo/Idh/MocA family oxidoreductase [Chloroflexota bacterium]MBL6979857.1 Gfo/Idh/MocA family oxidoreductase [Anaerolineales bacterium]
MKFLIAGFGSIGRRHFRNLYALGERDFVFLRSKRGTLPDEEIADRPVETDLASALAYEPDAVIVSNPTSVHLDVAIPAAEAGCHLLLEKPISHSMERVDELNAAVSKGGGQVLVGFQFRYHPLLRKTAALIADEAIGRPVSARVHWGEYLPGWHPWEDYRKGFSARTDLGGGVILTLTTHPLDYLRWLMGDVEALWAFSNPVKELEIDVESVAEIGLRFANGALGSVHLSFIQRPYTHDIIIVGTQGSICVDIKENDLRVYRASADEWEVYSSPEGFERNTMFEDQMAHLLAVMHGEEEPVCTLDDGIWAQKLAMAAHDSASSGRVVAWDAVTY